MSHDDRRRLGPHKKTASIEVRVSEEEKDSFLTACRKAGRSASDIIREGMAQFARRSRNRRSGLMFASASLATLVMAAALIFASPPQAPEPEGEAAPVQLTVNILDAEGRPAEQRVMGLGAAVDPQTLFPDAEIVSETRSGSAGYEQIELTIRPRRADADG